MSTNTILVVDDEVFNLQILHDILTHQGYRIFTATSVETAFKQIQAQNTLDAAILDVYLSDGYGFSLIPLIRGRFPQARIILMSSITRAEAPGLDKATFERFLEKPLQPQQLLRILSELF